MLWKKSGAIYVEKTNVLRVLLCVACVKLQMSMSVCIMHFLPSVQAKEVGKAVRYCKHLFIQISMEYNSDLAITIQ